MSNHDPAVWTRLKAEIDQQLKIMEQRGAAHEIIGVGLQASVDEVQRVFDAWARKLHPDRLQGAPDDLRTAAGHLFIAVKDARDSLLNREKSQAQVKAEDVLTAIQRAQEAEIEYIQGKRALDLGQLETAEDCLRRAVSMEPQNGGYLAELTWVRFRRTPEPQRTRQLPGLIAEMQRTAQLSPKSGRVAYLLGMLFQAKGNMRDAEQAFRAAAGMGSREAGSELQLLKTRRRTGVHPQAPSAPKAPVQTEVKRGILGRLFFGPGKHDRR